MYIRKTSVIMQDFYNIFKWSCELVHSHWKLGTIFAYLASSLAWPLKVVILFFIHGNRELLSDYFQSIVLTPVNELLNYTKRAGLLSQVSFL